MPQDSNFYRVYKLAYRDRSESLKSLILVAIIVSCLSLASLLTLGAIKNFSLTILIGASALWLVSFALLPIFFLVAPKSHFYFFTILFSVVPFLPIILDQTRNQNLIFVILAIIISFFWAGWKMKIEANSLIDLNLSRIISKGVLFLSLVFFIVIGSLVYFEKNNLDLGQYKLDNLISPNGGIIRGINLGGTVDDVLLAYLKTESSQLGILNYSAQQLLLKQTREGLSQMLGLTITGKETITNLLFDYFKLHWSTMSFPLKIIVYFVFLTTAWSILVAFNYLFGSLIIILSWLLFKFLILVKYLQIKKVGIEKDEIALA
ncbi:MAG: hypothetical protein ACP5RX_00290 [Minisyncoccia bacterium]